MPVDEVKPKDNKEASVKKIKDAMEERAKALQEMYVKQQEGTKPRVHVVEYGDTLSAIAKKYYGNARLYPKLYEANKELIGPDMNKLLVGWEIVLPDIEDLKKLK
jgi:nucleoid-associated protein YgaU